MPVLNASEAPGTLRRVRGVRPDIVVLREESIPEVLARIRAHQAPRVVLDCADHRLLHDQGHVRRLLAVAAADLGKTLSFVENSLGTDADRDNTVSRRAAVVRDHQRKLLDRPGAKRLSQDRTSQSSSWKSLPDSVRPVRLLTAFAFAAGALLAGVVLFILPRSRVTLATITEPLSADLTVELAVYGDATDEVNLAHPGRHVAVEETVQGEFPAETVVERGERAQGTVVLVNRTSAPQGIKTGTRLQDQNGVVVRTQKDAIIPPQGRAPVAVRAEAGGTAGNLSPQHLSMPALPKESRQLLFADVVESLRGGTDRPVRVVSSEDIRRASESLKALVEGRLKEKLRTEFGAESAWFERSELLRTVVTDESPSVPLKTETDKFQLRVTVRAEALTASGEALRSALDSLLRSRAGEGKDIVRGANLDDLRVLDVRWDDLRATLSLHAETTVVPALKVEELKEQLSGRSVADAEAFLQALPGVRRASVSLSPVWVKHVPENNRNVHVTVEHGT